MSKAELGISTAQRKESVHYEPVPAKALRSMLRTLSIDHGGYTFIDFGSGKGCALLLASEYPCRRIIRDRGRCTCCIMGTTPAL